MSIGRKTRWMAAAFGAGLLTVAGCQDPKAEEVQRNREMRIQNVLQAYSDREFASQENLDHIHALIMDDWADHQEKLKTDEKRLRDWADQERHRWVENQDTYETQIRKQLDGDWQKVEEVPPKIFY